MISATILVKNGEKHLEKVLQALSGFSEVVVLDTGSSDSTIEIAKKFPNVTLYEKAFIGFGPSHNELSSLARHDWILSVDADEVVTKELCDEVLTLPLDENSVYGIGRHNFFRNKIVYGCGWYPDIVWRLYNRKKTRFSDAQVHESLITEGLKRVCLKGHIQHYPYETISDFLSKMQYYSTLFAKQYQGKKKSSLWHAIGHGLFAFFKSYILKRGFMSGSDGFIISLYNGHTAYYKYLKLQEMNDLF
jgi:glycosyltransferase involved in cell wall biosynthesis